MTATQHVNSFLTIPAAQLRVGGLIHHPGIDGATYVLVARVAVVDAVVHLMVYDTAHTDGAPAAYQPQDRVLLACRDLIEPDDGLRAWTDASWRRAHRRGAAFAPRTQPATSSSTGSAGTTRSRRGCCPSPSSPMY